MMYRVLLVDDEPLILSGIKFMIDWKKNGCELSGTARNGKQALKAVEDIHPDIIIADINMPVMSGIELLSQVQSKYPGIVFIMLTNLQEFDLARECLRMRAVDYLIKTQLQPEILEESLHIAKKEADERENRAQMDMAKDSLRMDQMESLKGAVKRMLVHGTMADGAVEVLRKNGVLNGYGVIKLLIDRSACKEKDGHRQLLPWLREVVTKLADNCFPRHLVLTSEPGYLFILCWDIAPEAYAGKVAIFSDKLASASDKIIGSIPVILATDWLQDVQSCGHGEEQLRALSEYAYLCGQKILLYKNLPETSCKPLLLEGIPGQLKAELNARNINACSTLLNRAISRIQEVPHEKGQAIWICEELYSVVCKSLSIPIAESYFSDSAAGYEDIGSLDTREQVILWLQKLRNEIVALLEPVNPRQTEMLDKVKQYVADHIDKRISLQDAADYVNISPAYLSAIFKQENHQGFVDYINQSKMERACRMIEAEKYRMSEIGYMLGFENAYYFSKVFRRHIGVSPTEYQRKAKQTQAAINSKDEHTTV